MSSGKTFGSSNPARVARVDAARKWVAEETRAEAKEVFSQHTRETSNLDVLSRCKKLNELLSSDVLSGKGDAKAQLKEILGILHTGPKRPAFLDKPPVTAIAGKLGASTSAASDRPSTSPVNCKSPSGGSEAVGRGTEGDRWPEQPVQRSLQRPSEEVEDIITLLNGPLPPNSAQVAMICGTTEGATVAKQQRPDESPQLISGEAIAEQVRPPLSVIAQQECKAKEAAEAAERERKAKEAAEAAERERKAKEAAEAAERERKAKEAAEAAERERKAKEAAEAAERERKAKEAAEAAERERKAKEAAEAAEQERKAKEAAEAAERERKAKEAAEAAERERKAVAEMERQRAAAEALRLQRVQFGAAVCIQAHWRGYCGRRHAAQVRQERAEQDAAASIMQAMWRSRQAAIKYRQRLVAAGMLQCAVRAWRARRHLHQKRVETFMRHHAARVIQRAFLAYRARGYTLGPLRVPPGPRPQSSLGVDGAALLAKQLRLRSAVDARLAPECVCNSSGGDDDSARQHRTVITHMERVRQVSANERNRRCDVGERAIMVGSEHRDTAEALAIARQGFGNCTPRAPSPSATWSPALEGIQLDSRQTSSRSASEAGGLLIPGALSCDPAFTMGSRPSTALRRAQGSLGA
ncbi:hypothetical protein Vretimale_4549 [Volvox reticuliferus]|uniref:Uncharacterized protein n=1 Tax=Volvox reticuliferus TaxID=1737510 RepID=A0A8J4DBJ6_9CHLO|nr:hypothetical protein Vretimale_4549 [Volvox reticuliferus]